MFLYIVYDYNWFLRLYGFWIKYATNYYYECTERGVSCLSTLKFLELILVFSFIRKSYLLIKQFIWHAFFKFTTLLVQEYQLKDGILKVLHMITDVPLSLIVDIFITKKSCDQL